jgi:putative CocE/NonD family hydrolase
MLVRARRTYPIVTEINVPMTTRDGVTLFADILRPDAPGCFPVLLSRTPYGKQSVISSPQRYASYGYVTVNQDVRGRFASEGDYYPLVNDISDGYDAVEWAAALPWSNGRVGTTGQSYLGATQYMIACHNPIPPHLVTQVPTSAAADYHEG